MVVPNVVVATNVVAIPTIVDHLVSHNVDNHTSDSDRKIDVENLGFDIVSTGNVEKGKSVIVQSKSSANQPIITDEGFISRDCSTFSTICLQIFIFSTILLRTMS